MYFGKKKLKLFVFSDDMIVYIEDPKESMEMLLDLKSKFIEVSGYESSILKKSVVFHILVRNNWKQNIF